MGEGRVGWGGGGCFLREKISRVTSNIKNGREKKYVKQEHEPNMYVLYVLCVSYYIVVKRISTRFDLKGLDNHAHLKGASLRQSEQHGGIDTAQGRTCCKEQQAVRSKYYQLLVCHFGLKLLPPKRLKGTVVAVPIVLCIFRTTINIILFGSIGNPLFTHQKCCSVRSSL